MRRVLVIDDDVAIQSALSSHLKVFHFKVDVASSGSQGLQLADESEPDYIICDLLMPEMDGFEFIHQLREKKKIRNVPVMILSARIDKDVRWQAYQNGAQAFIEKPFEGRRIVNMIIATLGIAMPEINEPESVDLDQKQSEFISAVSHELRTPMTSIKSAVGLIGDGTLGPLNDEQRDFFDLLERNVSRLTKLIDEILSFSRIESGRLNLVLGEVNVSQMVRSIVKEFSARAENIPGRLKAVGDEELVIRCDPEKLYLILYYLLDNAFNHNMPDTEIEVGVQRNGGSVRLYVQDRGQGILPEDIGKIFNRFHQIDRQVGDGSKGIGLGLAICKGLVEAHGGTLNVDSIVGTGSTFFFDLDLL